MSYNALSVYNILYMMICYNMLFDASTFNNDINATSIPSVPTYLLNQLNELQQRSDLICFLPIASTK